MDSIYTAEQQWTRAITKLQLIADLRHLQPARDAPGWLQRCCELARFDPGTLAVLGPNQLWCEARTFGRRPADIDSVGLLTAAVAVAMMRRSERFLLATVPGADHLPLFIGVIGLLGDTVREQLFPAPHRDGTLIISSDLELRATYIKLRIDKASIDAVHPGSRLTSSGSIEYIAPELRVSARAAGARTGVCFMYPTRLLPPRVAINPRYVILDLRYGREADRSEALLTWVTTVFPQAGLVALYTQGDDATERVASRFLPHFFNVDYQATATCQKWLYLDEENRERSLAPARSLHAALLPSLHFIQRQNYVHVAPVTSDASRFLKPIDRTLRAQKIADPALNRARWLLSTIRDLPFALHYYEEAARARGRYTLKKMIAGLQGLVRNPELRPVVQSIAVAFDEAYKGLLEECPRAALYKSVIEHASQDHDESIVLLVKDTISVAGATSWIQDTVSDGSHLSAKVTAIKFSNAWQLQNTAPAMTILTGVLPFQHRWLYGANLGQQAVHVCDEDQVDRLLHLLRSPLDPLGCSRASTGRYRILGTITGTQLSASGADVRVVLPHVVVYGKKQSGGDVAEATVETPPAVSHRQKLKTVGHSLADLGKVLGRLSDLGLPEGFEEAESPGSEDSSENDEPDNIDDGSEEISYGRVLIGLRDDERVRVVLHEQSHYEVLRANGALSYVAPTDMAAGDTLLLTDAANRITVFDQMLSMVEQGARMKSLAKARNSWSAAVERLRRLGLHAGRVNYSALLRRLRKAGADIESELTVKNWIDGSVIGPAKISSIRAVATVIESPDMEAHAGDYDVAFRAIRSIHQALGREINSIIRGATEEFYRSAGPSDDNLEERFALPLRELMQSIAPIKIEEIAAAPTPQPRRLLNEVQPL